MEKALLLMAAAQLVTADMEYYAGGGNASGPAFDATKPGTVTQGEMGVNSNCWELLRIYYAALVQAHGDDTDWPAPVGSAGSQGQPPLPAIPGTTTGNIVALAKAILGAVSADPSLTAKLNALIPAAVALLPGGTSPTSPPATSSTPASTQPATVTTLPAASVSRPAGS